MPKKLAPRQEDGRLTQRTRCTNVEAFCSHVHALRITPKYKLLDPFRCPIRKKKLKDEKPSNFVISDYLLYLSNDGEAEILQYVPEDFNEKLYSNINHVFRASIRPLSYVPVRLNFAEKAVAMVFASFKHMASWLGIKRQKDLDSMAYHTKTIPHHCACSC